MPTEFEIIRRYFSRGSRRDDVIAGVGDDAALLDAPRDRELVAAVDSINAGVHFPPQLSAADIGHRALAVNLSDLAAMGAEPAWMLLALSLEQSKADWLEGFAAGLYALADRYDVALVGGDTVRGALSVTVTLLGAVERGQALRRSGARPGDRLWVSGLHGEAAAGLAVLQGTLNVTDEVAATLQRRFCRPEPRIALGRRLRGVATAAIDTSDGLHVDLGRLAKASGVGAVVDCTRLPLSTELCAAVSERRALELALGGGDDYELCFSAPAARSTDLQRIGEELGLALACIGEIVETPGVALRDAPADLEIGGFEHFGRG